MATFAVLPAAHSSAALLHRTSLAQGRENSCGIPPSRVSRAYTRRARASVRLSRQLSRRCLGKTAGVSGVVGFWKSVKSFDRLGRSPLPPPA